MLAVPLVANYRFAGMSFDFQLGTPFQALPAAYARTARC